MKRINTSIDSNGVSPVVGVILMVAVVTILMGGLMHLSTFGANQAEFEANTSDTEFAVDNGVVTVEHLNESTDEIVVKNSTTGEVVDTVDSEGEMVDIRDEGKVSFVAVEKITDDEHLVRTFES